MAAIWDSRQFLGIVLLGSVLDIVSVYFGQFVLLILHILDNLYIMLNWDSFVNMVKSLTICKHAKIPHPGRFLNMLESTIETC